MTEGRRKVIARTAKVAAVAAAVCAVIWARNHFVQEEIKAEIAAVQKTPSSSARESMLEGADARYALEIRALGVAAHDYFQDELWTAMEDGKSTGKSVFSNGASDTARDAHDRFSDLRLASEATFKYVGHEAVSDWPVPTFAAEPPDHSGIAGSAGDGIRGSASSAGLAYTYFLWEDDLNAEDASPLVDKMFAFFDANPHVPEAVLMIRDADKLRERLGPIGFRLPEGPIKPTILTSVVTLLVSRTDRVDRYLRPYARYEEQQATNADQTNHDYIKQYLFYNKLDRESNERLDRKAHPGLTTVRSEYWAEQVPRLLATVNDPEDKRPYKTPYLPLRWMTWQIRSFDSSPLMGYLHRPVTIRLRDDKDKPLTGKARTEALRQGWQSALASLPEGTSPERVFHDRTHDGGVRRELAPILMEGAHPLDLNDVDQGFDIGVRIGNTGITSPFVQIALATIAGYKKGGAAATVHRRNDGDVTVTMVSPPDAASKAAWEGESKKNPFTAHVAH